MIAGCHSHPRESREMPLRLPKPSQFPSVDRVDLVSPSGRSLKLVASAVVELVGRTYCMARPGVSPFRPVQAATGGAGSFSSKAGRPRLCCGSLPGQVRGPPDDAPARHGGCVSWPTVSAVRRSGARRRPHPSVRVPALAGCPLQAGARLRWCCSCVRASPAVALGEHWRWSVMRHYVRGRGHTVR